MGESESRKRSFVTIDDEDDIVSISSSEEDEEEEETSSSSFSGETSEDHSEWSANEEGEGNSEEDDEEGDSEEDDEGDSEGDDEEEEEEDIRDDEGDVKDLGLKNTHVDDRTVYNRVIHLLKGGGDLQSLKHEECKVYLRKHGLRLSGTKSICAQRIQEHWRIKDGGEKLYPWSSFTINCTGDVCRGDVVKFKQKVYEKFDKVSRTGNLRGKRTVAGRVVKESYGAAKQQHTFTVEVLWSRGLKKLPPLFPLLVKGRNLYRMKTYRQPWDNEAERSKVLSEKHKRGSAARLLRATKRVSTANGGAKRQKHSHHTVPAPSGRSREAQLARKPERKHATGCGKAPREVMKKSSRVSKSRGTIPPSDRDLQPNRNRGNGTRPQISHPSNELFNFSNNEIGSTASHTRRPPHHPYSTVVANSQHPHHRHAYANPATRFKTKKSNHCQEHTSSSRRINTVHPGATGFQRGVKSSVHLLCSKHGCTEKRDDKCSGLLCWRCCRVSGRWCYSHR